MYKNNNKNDKIFNVISRIDKTITVLLGFKLVNYMIPLIFPSILYVINYMSFRTLIIYYIGLGFIMALVKIVISLLNISILSKLEKNYDAILEYCKSLPSSKSSEIHYVLRAMKFIQKSAIILVKDQTCLEKLNKEISTLVDIMNSKKISEN